MTTTSPATNSALEASSEQGQAFALWTFVHLKTPRFTSSTALDVIQQLAPRPEEEPKTVARRLREVLLKYGVALKQTAALEAAARLLGHASWHAANRSSSKLTLKLMQPGLSGDTSFSDWQTLVAPLYAACETWLHQTGGRIFELSFGPTYMMLNAQVARESETAEYGKPAQTWPLVTVTPIESSTNWLDGAPSALETLRRRLEETGKAVLDGVAVMQLCAAYRSNSSIDMHGAKLDDVCNSELVLMREDNELNPASGYEIARGDELLCWAQLELAGTGDDTGGRPQNVVVRDGAWFIDDARFVWQLATLRPNDIIPGLINRELNNEDVTKLWRRYRLTRNVFPNGLAHRQAPKRLDYLGSLPETYRVNLHNLLLEMNKAGLTWETYCAEIGNQVPMEPNLNVGFVISLVERLGLKEPNKIFARPNRSQLVKVTDDTLLRALVPRVDHVSYRLPYGLGVELKDIVRDAVEEFSASLRTQKLIEGGAFVSKENPLPHLVYSNDAEDLRLTLLEHGLVMYVGVIPRLFPTENLPDAPPGLPPYAVGNSLYLDIDLEEGGVQ